MSATDVVAMVFVVVVGLVIIASFVVWRRRHAAQLSAHDRYRRDIGYLWSDRQVLRAKRIVRAEKRRRFWAAGSAGSVGGYYSGGGSGGGCSAGGSGCTGGGGCGGGGCGGGGCGGGGG